ncbi:MAG: hypothetical protein NC336_04170 [Clostridium sp.]|nr:hypothetical protein [Clostridium sp.]
MAFFLSLFFFFPGNAYGILRPEKPDTVIVEYFDDDYPEIPAPASTDTELRVVSYTPITDPGQFLQLNADSLPLLNRFPRWARRFINSWTQPGIDRTRQRRFDVSFAVSPSYTREASFGIGGAITGLYRLNRRDSLPQPSLMFASVNASVNGFYVFRTRGNIYFPDAVHRINYRAEVSRKSLDFWGISAYDTYRNPKSAYVRNQISLYAEFIRRIHADLYVGPAVNLNYTNGRHFRNREYLAGERPEYFVAGVGMTFQYDTRDVATAPSRGLHISYSPTFYPKCFGNAPRFFQSHSLTVDLYRTIWPGGVLGIDLHGVFNSRSTPWTMKEMVASDGIRMRGYYMGSYIDNNQISAQVELRQHLIDRIGVAIWAGGATIFSRIGHDRSPWTRQLWLPNAGLGLRVQFKPRVSGRIDCGFGRNTMGVLFSIGEAF